MDYAEGKHSDQIISDAKYVFPLIVMFLPLPFFWALFDMKGAGSNRSICVLIGLSFAVLT